MNYNLKFLTKLESEETLCRRGKFGKLCVICFRSNGKGCFNRWQIFKWKFGIERKKTIKLLKGVWFKSIKEISNQRLSFEVKKFEFLFWLVFFCEEMSPWSAAPWVKACRPSSRILTASKTGKTWIGAKELFDSQSIRTLKLYWQLVLVGLLDKVIGTNQTHGLVGLGLYVSDTYQRMNW